MNLTSLWNLVVHICGWIYNHNDSSASETPSPNKWALQKDFDTMTRKLEAVESQLQDTDSRLKLFEEQVQKLKEKESTWKNCCSSAGAGKAQSGYLNTGITLMYRMVINYSIAEDTLVGVFISPYNGIYYFVSDHTGGRPGTELVLYKDGKQVTLSQSYPSDHRSFSSRWSLELKAGDHLYVRMGQNRHEWGSAGHTTFSGFLVDVTLPSNALS